MKRSAPRIAISALAACVATGCWSVDSADLPEISAAHGLVLTEFAPQDGTVEPIASLQVSKSGFYLFGFAPIVEISLHEAIDTLALLAKEHGADGVCNVRYHYNPPHPLKFIVFPVPDWSASVQVFGMAYRNALATRDDAVAPPFEIEDPRASATPGK